MTFLRTSLLLAFLLGCGAAEGEREQPAPVASSPTEAEGPAPVRVELERVETARLPVSMLVTAVRGRLRRSATVCWLSPHFSRARRRRLPS